MLTVVGEPCPYCRDTKKVLAYLHSQGVVLKVEGELPEDADDLERSVWSSMAYDKAQQDMLEAGYTATVPLEE